MATFDSLADGKLLKQPFPIEIIEVEPLEAFELLPGVKALAVSTPHTDDSYAIRIADADASVVYTSDTGFQKDLSTFAKEVDLLLIESSFVRDKKVERHLELSEAIYLIQHARPKRAMLTHLYGEWDSVDFKNEVASFDPVCEVIEAVDGLRVDI
jgi:ribonuclease BN (tRNA processing enzyme)